MAINPENQYPGKIAPSTPQYPYGAARNVTVPGDGTGTPWEAAIVNDLLGFQQAMLDRAGITPSGTPDQVGSSQYLVALLNIMSARSSARFKTVANMAAGITSDGGPITFKVDQTLAVDGENGLTDIYIVVNSANDVDLGGGLWAKKLTPGAAFKTVAPNGTDSKLEYASFNDFIGALAAKMWAGETVSIACYGDSTTDGNETTGWTANPTDGGGNAIGNSDHNITAPNAWPARLQTMLRDMYRNTNIDVFNAGYSGKRIDDGWAVANYDTAVIDNPFYGTPDITFIGFGLNDITAGGSQIDDHIAQTRILMRQIIDDGTVPVLLTTDAEFRNGQFGTVRDHKEARRELDSAKKSLAAEFGVPLVDMGAALKGWIQNNTDGFNWSTEQDDGLHFQDNGHSFKAQFATMVFFNDAVEFTGGTQQINTWSSQTEYVGNYAARFKLANNSQGGNISYGAGAPDQDDVMTMWVWSEVPNAYLIYQGIDNESYDGGLFTVEPSIIVKEWFGDTELSKDIISVGNSTPLAAYRRSDEQFIHSKLKYGLNKVRYRSGDSPQLFYGSFRIVEADEQLAGNALHKTGRFARTYAANTGIHIIPFKESPDLINTVGVYDGEKISISFSVDANEQSGALLLHGQGFDTTQSAVDNNRQNAILVFRGTGGVLEVYNVSYDDTGAVVFNLLASGGAASWSTTNFTGRFEMEKVAGAQRLTVYDAYSGGSVAATVDLATDQTCRWSGFVGGTFFNSDAVGGTAGTIQINDMVINRE